MSTSVYRQSPENVQKRTQEVVRSSPVIWSDLPLAPHDTAKLQACGVLPNVAHARGYRSWSTSEAAQHGFSGSHARDTLAIPVHSLAAEFDDYLLRPHTPPIDDKTGKTRKYMWRPGHTPALGGPPAGTPAAEARAHALRDDLTVPVIVTESVIKSDSVLSHAATAVYTMAIHGTWNWVADGATSPELRDVPWRSKRGDKITHRRLVILVPDSDYSTKPEVAFGWWQFGQALKRRKADVRIYHLPAAPDGSKLGPDDALVQGVVSVAQMLADAVPLPNELPEIARLDTGAPVSDMQARQRIATLEADLARKDALISALVRVSVSPDLNRAQAIPGIRALVTAHYKRSQGEVDHEGYAVLSSREIANDWRTADDPKADYNPVDGSRPFMQCSRVKSQMETLQAAGAIDIRTRETKRPRPGAIPYTDTEYLVKVDDLPSALIQLADYRKPERKKPTPTPPCRHCGEIHPRTKITVCQGCGVEDREDVPVILAEAPEIVDISTSSKFEELENVGDAPDSSAPLTNCLQTLKSREDDVPLVPRCTWHVGEGETCGDPTEWWEHEGYGNTRLCTRHAERMRNSDAPPPRIYRGEVVA